MTKRMEGIVFHAARLQCLFQMLIYRLMVERAAEAIGEHQIERIVPQLTGEQPLLLLLAVLLPQDADGAYGEYNAPLLVFFWRGEIVVECAAFMLLLQLLPNDDAVFSHKISSQRRPRISDCRRPEKISRKKML